MKHGHDNEFVGKLKGVLDEGAESLDDATLVRLQHARRQALRQGGQQRGRPITAGWIARWIPATGLAAAMAVLVATTLWMAIPQMDLPSVEEIELLTSNENLELLDELEFYQWLDEDGIHAS